MGETTSVQATRVGSFLQSLGVNTHMSWQNPGMGYANVANVESDIAYLGVTHVRDGLPYAGWTVPEYAALAQQGIKFDIIMPGGTLNYAGALADINALAQAAPGSVATVEGPNEINSNPIVYNGQSSTSSLAVGDAAMAGLDAALKADPSLAGVGVVNLTLGGGTASQYAALGNMSAVANYGNAHIYFGNGQQPGAEIAANIAQAKATNPGESVDITETGYYTATQSTDWGGVNQDVQAKETLNALFDAFKDGASTTYLYELMDTAANPSPTDREDSFGLFNENGTPKEAATALHNLTTLLADNGSTAQTFTAGSLSYGLSGMPSTGNSMLMQTSSGNFDLALWAEPTIWNEATESEVTAPASSVTVSLGATYKSVSVYDPLAGTSPIATYTNVSQVTLSLTDHPLIVQVAPGTVVSAPPPVTSTPVTTPPVTTAPPSTTPPPALSVGSGPDVLMLSLDEDAYQGNAQFTVSVDGAQIGGTLTATALRSSGHPEQLAVYGTFGSGPHTVAVDFLNDAYGGSASLDRNLYVTGASLNGTAISGTALSLMNAGTQTFNFQQSSSEANPTGMLDVGLSEDAYLGNAEFTISVDGKQIGGALPVTALHSQGASQLFAFADTLAAGTHSVAISFIDDAYGGSSALDRNLYVTGISYNGTAQPGTTATLDTDGTQKFLITVPAAGSATTAGNGGLVPAGAAPVSAAAPVAPTTAPPTLVVGSGADLLSLSIAEDAYLGDAQFTVSVDGQQIGGTMTATALHDIGSSQALDILGNFSAGPHTVSVDFLNDAYGGTLTTDRNLYVDGASLNGSAIANSALTLATDGTQSISFTNPAAPSAAAVQAGSPGLITVSLAEDAYQGNAQFIVSVDGVQLGAAQQVSALHSQGASEAFTFEDALAAGTHDVAVSFINDLYAGTPTTDRNLYVTGVSYDSTPQSGGAATLLGNGGDHFSLVVPSSVS
jgi:hypothetical protein